MASNTQHTVALLREYNALDMRARYSRGLDRVLLTHAKFKIFDRLPVIVQQDIQARIHA